MDGHSASRHAFSSASHARSAFAAAVGDCACASHRPCSHKIYGSSGSTSGDLVRCNFMAPVWHKHAKDLLTELRMYFSPPTFIAHANWPYKKPGVRQNIVIPTPATARWTGFITTSLMKIINNTFLTLTCCLHSRNSWYESFSTSKHWWNLI